MKAEPTRSALIQITVDDVSGPEIVAFLEEHVAQLRRISPPESSHALDLVGLRHPDVTLWVARREGEAVGCGALKRLSATHGEVKSMRTAESWVGQGIGASILTHLITEGEARGWDRLSLETGSQEFFAPARRLYARHGFVKCEPFADYRPDPLSIFMTRTLNA